MNIIYMHTHDTGRYIEPYGYPVKTPSLMQLASEGFLFRQAYSGGPTCSPSRTALLTGMAAHSTGMIGLAHRGFSLNDYGKHLAQFLRHQGYETVLSGIQHEAADFRTLQYENVIGSPHDDMARIEFDSVAWDHANADAVVQFIQAKHEKPFFLSFGMFNTHREFPEVDPDIQSNYINPPFPLYDSKKGREDFAGFLTSVRIVDQCVEKVLDALRTTRLDEDTIIIFTTDHGIAFPHMKCNLLDTGIGVSLILKYPGQKTKGGVVDALVSQIDLYPTLCDLLQIDKPEWLQGTSLIPLLNGEKQSIRNEIFAEVTYHAAYEPMRCIRTERYKYIRLFDETHQGYVPANIDDCNSKDFLLQHGFLQLKRGDEYLFDLYLDPVERVNFIDHPDYQEVRSDLSSRLSSWMAETDDPVLLGKVPKPIGAVANKVTCISPRVDDFEA